MKSGVGENRKIKRCLSHNCSLVVSIFIFLALLIHEFFYPLFSGIRELTGSVDLRSLIQPFLSSLIGAFSGFLVAVYSTNKQKKQRVIEYHRSKMQRHLEELLSAHVGFIRNAYDMLFHQISLIEYLKNSSEIELWRMNEFSMLRNKAIEAFDRERAVYYAKMHIMKPYLKGLDLYEKIETSLNSFTNAIIDNNEKFIKTEFLIKHNIGSSWFNIQFYEKSLDREYLAATDMKAMASSFSSNMMDEYDQLNDSISKASI